MRISSAVAVCVVVVLSLVGQALAKRTYGSTCGSCHSTSRAGIDVTGDGGAQTPGGGSPALKTFSVVAGESIPLKANVFDDHNDKYGVTFKGFDTTAGEVNAANALSFTPGTNTGWAYTSGGSRVAKTTPYYYYNSYSSTSPKVWTFDITVDAATPADFYQLRFGMGAGNEEWHDDVSFYLHVQAFPDATGDGGVDDNDLSLVLAHWGQSTDAAHGEFTGVAPVNDNDLSLLLSRWTGPVGSQSPVPEPASLTVLVGGSVVLLRRRRRT